MSSSLKRNECKRQCRYEYTEEERAEKGRNLADELGALKAVESELERIKKDYKARIDSRGATIDNLSEQVRTGYELRETLCFWEFNLPKPGRKILKRADTLEIIEETDMTGADTQLVMDALDAEAAEAEQPKPLAIQNADLPVMPWPETNAFALSSDIFDANDCACFAEMLHGCYYDHDALINFDDSTAAIVATRVLEDDDATISNWLQWLEERSRPGGRFVATCLRVEHAVRTEPEVKAEKAKTTPAKSNTPGRKARRAASNGVVGTEADGPDLTNPDDSKS